MKRVERILALVAAACLALTIAFAPTEVTGSETAIWQANDLRCDDITGCDSTAGCGSSGTDDNCVLDCTNGGTVKCNSGLE